MSRVHPIRSRSEAAGLAVGVRLANALPERLALALGSGAGQSAARLWPRARRVIPANLERVFPEWSAARRDALLRDHLALLGRSTVTWARLPALSAEEILERVTFEGLEVLEGALRAGRGVIVASAHFGCWELMLPALRLRLGNPDLTAVERAQRNPRLRASIEARRRLGGGPAPLPQDARSVLRTLARGGGVGLLADHYLSPRRGGRLAPFLGLRAWTNPGPAALALRSGSPLLLGHTRPLPDGRHLIALGPEITPPASGDRTRDVALMTEQVNATLGAWIRERPEAWLWLHRRFRRSPDLEGGAERSRRESRVRRRV